MKFHLEWVRVIPDRRVNPDTSTFIEFMKTQTRISEYLFNIIINEVLSYYINIFIRDKVF